MTTLFLTKTSGRSSLRRSLPRKQQLPRTQAMWTMRGLLLIPLLVACFALAPAPNVFGVSPPPGGDYSGQNTALGKDALFSLTIGVSNTAIGYNALYSNTQGTSNTANGDSALYSNTTGNANTANGLGALQNNNGSNNTANGFLTLFSNTTGGGNTATGFEALRSNMAGGSNTANGMNALRNNNGSFNTANGANALQSNLSGSDNTANGVQALNFNTGGSSNTANGRDALFLNTGGSLNTATGASALGNNNGNSNTANGFQALLSNTSGSDNTASGLFALRNNTTGNVNIALGSSAGQNLTTGNNNIDIGNDGFAGDADTIRIGTAGMHTSTFVAGIIQSTVGRSVGVVVNAFGRLGTVASSERFKAGIKPMDKASEAILALKPVSFRYKQELDPEGVPQFGLVAEEVEKVNPDLVVHDDQGKLYSVRYEAVNAMLLNEFLKQHRKVQAQETTITQLRAAVAQQQKGMEALTASVKEQAAQIQKVSAQIEVTKSAPRVVDNNQ